MFVVVLNSKVNVVKYTIHFIIFLLNRYTRNRFRVITKKTEYLNSVFSYLFIIFNYDNNSNTLSTTFLIEKGLVK